MVLKQGLELCRITLNEVLHWRDCSFLVNTRGAASKHSHPKFCEVAVSSHWVVVLFFFSPSIFLVCQ